MSVEHLSEVRADPKVLDFLAHDPVMAGLIEKHGPYSWGLHPVFPSLLRAVVGQQLSNAVARTIFARLKHATDLDPERVIELGEEGLRSLGLAYAKARALHGIAHAELAGELDRLEELSDKEVTERLAALRGVGPWTAQMVLIFSLGRLDVWPTSDLGMVRQAEKLYGLSSKREVADLGERFRPYRSVAAHYLWTEGDTRV
ncbi:DNA-3-methyladenine glycosylase family protein [Oceanithermus sp.]